MTDWGGTTWSSTPVWHYHSVSATANGWCQSLWCWWMWGNSVATDFPSLPMPKYCYIRRIMYIGVSGRLKLIRTRTNNVKKSCGQAALDGHHVIFIIYAKLRIIHSEMNWTESISRKQGWDQVVLNMNCTHYLYNCLIFIMLLLPCILMFYCLILFFMLSLYYLSIWI